MRKQMAKGTLSFPQDTFSSSLQPDSAPTEISPTSSVIFLYARQRDQSCQKDDTYTAPEGQSKLAEPSHIYQNPSLPTNARQLLDPKGYKTVQANRDRQSEKNAANQPSPHPQSNSQHVNGVEHAATKRELEDENGMGNFIEQLHGVSGREERPIKKQKVEKTEDLDEDKKRSFIGGGEGGELSNYVKEKKAEGQADPTSVVDLTQGKLLSPASLVSKRSFNSAIDILQETMLMMWSLSAIAIIVKSAMDVSTPLRSMRIPSPLPAARVGFTPIPGPP